MQPIRVSHRAPWRGHIAVAGRDLRPSPLNAAVARLDAEEGEVVLEPRRRKVALIGATAAWQRMPEAPLDDPAWEVWGLNACPPVDRAGRLRADRWFDVHELHAQNERDLAWIRQCPVPLYMPEVYPGLNPRLVRYPVERAEALVEGVSYFTCTFAYQLALALLEGFEDVGLFGLELMWGTWRERTVEWACVSFWLGVLMARGVRVHTPAGSALARHTYRYGIDYDEEKADVEEYVETMREVDRLRAGAAPETDVIGAGLTADRLLKVD